MRIWPLKGLWGAYDGLWGAYDGRLGGACDDRLQVRESGLWVRRRSGANPQTETPTPLELWHTESPKILPNMFHEVR